MQSNGKEPSDFMEEMARYNQLLQGHVYLTEEILENMHRITISLGKKWQKPGAEQDRSCNENQGDKE